MSQNDQKPVSGKDHHKEIGDGYIDDLARYWPEPREQLHHGGWDATYALSEQLELPRASSLLDICCGEGATANWLGRQYGIRVVGVDLVEAAVAHGQSDSAAGVNFARANVFNLPFADASFDIVYGQDPDGLAHHERSDIFRECFRVLRPGGHIGFHHWTVFDDVPGVLGGEFEAVNAALGYPSMRRLRVADYVHDLQAAGFQQVTVEDMSAVYRQHLFALRDNIMQNDPDAMDDWTAAALKILDSGWRLGARFFAYRPMTG